LAETIPGRHYRNRQVFQDEAAALAYFRNVVEDHAQGGTSTTEIKDLLGAEYLPKYQNLLRYIPPEQLHQVDTVPLGSGANGAIFGALWKPPPALLSTLQPPDRNLPVVLKRTLPTFSADDSLKKILHEVNPLNKTLLA
jgi:serine/threonine protein kinase